MEEISKMQYAEGKFVYNTSVGTENKRVLFKSVRACNMKSQQDDAVNGHAYVAIPTEAGGKPTLRCWYPHTFEPFNEPNEFAHEGGGWRTSCQTDQSLVQRSLEISRRKNDFQAFEENYLRH